MVYFIDTECSEHMEGEQLSRSPGLLQKAEKLLLFQATHSMADSILSRGGAGNRWQQTNGSLDGEVLECVIVVAVGRLRGEGRGTTVVAIS